MNTKVKICGIRTLEAARAAVSAGADFLGFNFIANSNRFLESNEARKIVEELPREIKIVGVFRNEEMRKVKEVIENLILDFVQLHGAEEPKYCKDLTNYAGVIKTFSLESNFDVASVLEEMDKYDVDYFLLDRQVQGEGARLSLPNVREVAMVKKIFLGGGLTAENVGEAVEIAKPYALDVASSIETDGSQDVEKIREFIRKAKLEL